MTAPRDRDARIAAFFQASQPDLPDRTFDAVHLDIHRTRQLIVVGPFREPDSTLGGRFVAAAVVVLAVGITLLATIARSNGDPILVRHDPAVIVAVHD